MVNSKKFRVLVIDDELTQQMLVKEYLEEAGHQVTATEDGKRGLKLAISTKPDIILLDYLLPQVDGNNVCKNLKANPATADIPIILVTASRESDVIDKGLAAGAEDFIIKPVDWAYLADRVVHVVRKAAEKRELTHRLQQQAAVAPPPSSVSMPATEMDARLEDLMRHAEMQVEQANGAIQAERARLEAEHAEALKSVREQVRAELAAEFAAERNAAAADANGVLENARAEAASEREALRTRYSAELGHAIEAVELEWSAKLEAAQAEIAHAAETIEKTLRAQWSDDVAGLKAQHEAELSSMRERADLQAGSIRAAAQREKVAADRRQAAEIAELRAALEEAVANASSNSHGVEAALADGAARVDAAWALAARAATAQCNLASSLAAKASLAAAQSGSPGLCEIDRFARALKSLTNNFKILTQAMAGTDEVKNHPVNLAVLFDEISIQAGRVAAARRVMLRSGAIDPSLNVTADENRLRYALMCLMTNAIRYTPAGGAVDITVSADDDGAMRIRVEDNGLGIPPAKLQELRDCLDVPAQAASSAVPETAGLGIPTVQALARRMSGVLELNSRLGGGTRAELIIPASRRALSEPRTAATG